MRHGGLAYLERRASENEAGCISYEIIAVCVVSVEYLIVTMGQFSGQRVQSDLSFEVRCPVYAICHGQVACTGETGQRNGEVR